MRSFVHSLLFTERGQRTFLFAGGCVLVGTVIFLAVGEIRASDPPIISNVHIVEVEHDSALIEWVTNKEADSLINYGLDRNYGMVRDPGADKVEHRLLLDGLLSGTTYHFRVTSRDPDGNQSVSSDYQFTTEGVSEVISTDQPTVDRVSDVIDDVVDVDDLVEIREIIQDRITEVSDELVIIGDPHVEVSEQSALVRWSTNRPAQSEVVFEEEATFDENTQMYSRSQSSAVESMEHEVELLGLTPATTYHFRAVARDSAGVEIRSGDNTFTTDALSPDIQNIELVQVGEDFALFEWSTTVPAESLIEYENIETGEVSTVGSPTLSSNHSVQLRGLEFGATYRATVLAIGEDGGVSESEPIEFVTVIDNEPPVISNVSTESTLFPGAEARVQTIVSWETNKLSVCRFNYQEGLAEGVDVAELEPRDPSFMESHVQVVTQFRQATVYRFWFVCEDRFGNVGRSENFVVFTPQQERNIIDIIIENFEGTFGWVRNLTN